MPVSRMSSKLAPAASVWRPGANFGAVSELGSVQKHRGGWRVIVFLGGEVTGPTHHGPAARRKAEADLAQAQGASTRDEMQQRLRDMIVASGQPAAPSVAVGPPEQAPAAPLVAVTASAAGGHGSKPGLPGKLAAPLVTVTACWSRFWAIQVSQDQASQLTVIAMH